MDIAIAMRVATGWFVDPGRARERAKRTDDVRIDRAMAAINWLDEIGAGVLGVSVEREGEVHRIRRSDAGYEEASTARNESDQRYCGIGAGGVPSCTDELVRYCNGSLEAFPNQYFEADFSPQADSGRVAVTVHTDNPSSCTFGLVLAGESYALPFAGLRPPSERWFEDFVGPFASLATHCREMREPAGGRCLMQPGRWNRRVKMLGARGRVHEVRLFRVGDSVAGIPVEYCRIAVATADGWYVNLGLDHCQGGDFGSGLVQTETLTLIWADGGPDPAFVITVRRREDEATFINAEQPTVGVVSDETERARLCVVPSNGPPHCGPEHVAACRDADRRWRKASLILENGRLVARPDPKVACRSGFALGAALSGD